MGSHHKRNEGLKPVRRTAAKPKPESKSRVQHKDARLLAIHEINQAFLSLLADHFRPILDESDFDEKLQQIKGHFFRRDYAQVFNDTEACKRYSVRYLPSRALAYAQLFAQESIMELLYPPPVPCRPSERKHLTTPVSTDTSGQKKVVAVGAGVGSELCALHLMNHIQISQLDSDEEDLREVLTRPIKIDIVDSADYQGFLQSLNQRLNQGFSHDSQEAAASEHHSLDRIDFQYHRQDILSWSSSPDFHTLLGETTLLTFMFVFNELFAASKLLTMRLIASVSQHLSLGSHVLLIESAGNLSKVTNPSKAEVEANEEKEREGLMVYKFWDHLPGFQKVLSEDRRWYRLDAGLQYPLELENVGYFVRLYRKIS